MAKTVLASMHARVTYKFVDINVDELDVIVIPEDLNVQTDLGLIKIALGLSECVEKDVLVAAICVDHGF